MKRRTVPPVAKKNRLVNGLIEATNHSNDDEMIECLCMASFMSKTARASKPFIKKKISFAHKIESTVSIAPSLVTSCPTTHPANMNVFAGVNVQS
jgi:hypothetical protein